MTNIRRYFDNNDTVFLTHVAKDRNPILIENAELLLLSINKFIDNSQYDVVSWVVLPDHFHILIGNADAGIPELMRKIKLSFSTTLRKKINIKSGRIWQFRYWDHMIRDQNNLNNHIDYVHFNPVKHGCTKNPFEWKYSSIHKYLDRGYYPRDWGVTGQVNFEGEYGE
jgi:putative transposase